MTPAYGNDTAVGLSWNTFLPLPSSGGKAAVRSDSRSLKGDPQKPVERQLQPLFLALPRRVCTSGRLY